MRQNGNVSALPMPLQLPTWSEDVQRFEKSEAFLKTEEYRRRLLTFERAHGVTLAHFRRKAKKGKEDFAAWDALLAWEAVAGAHRAWRKRYQALQ